MHPQLAGKRRKGSAKALQFERIPFRVLAGFLNGQTFPVSIERELDAHEKEPQAVVPVLVGVENVRPPFVK